MKKLLQLDLANVRIGFVVVCALGLPAHAVLGDLGTSFSADGNVGLEVAAYANTNVQNTSGTLTLNNIPVGATILQAWLYGHNWFTSETPSATFDGNGLGAVTAFDVSLEGHLEAYRWDVTSLISGNGSYTATAGPFGQAYGMALAVAFAHPSLPVGRLIINDGATDVADSGAETESTTFDALAGPGTLWIFTQADNFTDNDPDRTNEEILFNGTIVGGPIDANLGEHASLFELPVTSVAGVNTAEIFSPSDRFGWHIAAMQVAGSPACFNVVSEEITCHADGETFTYTVEGTSACTGGTLVFVFTASGGAVGEELCFTTLVNDGGFCCSTEICVTIPDCTPAAKPSDLDGDGIVGMADFLALLAAWGSCSDCGTCPADFDGDCSVGILDLLILLGNWG